jgi:hypothetical protein
VERQRCRCAWDIQHVSPGLDDRDDQLRPSSREHVGAYALATGRGGGGALVNPPPDVSEIHVVAPERDQQASKTTRARERREEIDLVFLDVPDWQARDILRLCVERDRDTSDHANVVDRRSLAD